MALTGHALCRTFDRSYHGIFYCRRVSAYPECEEICREAGLIRVTFMVF